MANAMVEKLRTEAGISDGAAPQNVSDEAESSPNRPDTSNRSRTKAALNRTSGKQAIVFDEEDEEGAVPVSLTAS
eukprot:917754-Rhodomonas_salina.1